MAELAEFVGAIKERTLTLEKITQDHESRVRKLERFVYLVIGGVYVAEKVFDLFLK